MKKRNMLWACIAAVFVTIMMASAAAHAKDYRMVVLIDASGSMVTGTRFVDAQTASLGDIGTISDLLAPGDTFLVAVYTFTCIDLPCGAAEPMVVQKTNPGGDPFVSKNAAIGIINGLTLANDIGGWTPLAGAMCNVVDTLMTRFPAAATVKVVSLSSDGEENATALAPCANDAGQPFYMGNSPYPNYSWQLHTVTHVNATPVIHYVNLFQLDFSLAARTVPDPEAGANSADRSLAPVRSAATGLTPLEEFFTFIVQGSGGTLHVTHDGEPLPVHGDLNDDRCVDRTDAILVARQFGPLVLPADGRSDLNLDRNVDFSDYQIQAARITPTCGPDPYVRRNPVACHGAARIVIDGQAIEDGGITIDARGACEITIKNSLIVSGKNAIKIVGTAALVVENSIIVGQDAVIMQHGASVLSAANSVFHGKLDTHGAFHYIDRGGNVFE